MNRTFRRTMLYTCWLPILGMAVAITFQALRITGKTSEYIAIGRIMAGMQLKPGDKPEAAFDTRYYGTQIEMLESSRLRNNAVVRVRSLHPELKEVPVSIRCTQTKGSAIINVVATGSEAKYTRVFLDAVLDEYIAMRKEMFENTTNNTMNKIIEEVLAREKVVKSSKKQWEDFLKTNDSMELMAAEMARLSQLVSLLRGEWESHKASRAPSDAALSAKIEAIEVRQKEAEGSLRAIHEKSVQAEGLKAEYERSMKDYEDWKKKLDQLNTADVVCGDPVAIMERPGAAVEDMPDLWVPLIVAAAGGFLGGLVLMIGISFLAAMLFPARE